jgi:hypothetical protein
VIVTYVTSRVIGTRCLARCVTDLVPYVQMDEVDSESFPNPSGFNHSLLTSHSTSLTWPYNFPTQAHAAAHPSQQASFHGQYAVNFLMKIMNS